jgi:hypothetical protein
MPGGLPIGQPGSSPDIREVPGGLQDALDMFDELTKGATPVVGSTHPKLFRLPGGGTVGMRPISKTGPPTIDVNIAGIPIRKVKFV